VLVIRRIHVHYRVRAPVAATAKVERVHGFHKEHCPVYRSLVAAIAITTTWERLEPEG